MNNYIKFIILIMFVFLAINIINADDKITGKISIIGNSSFETIITPININNYNYKMTNNQYTLTIKNNTNLDSPVKFEKEGYFFIYDISQGLLQWRAKNGQPSITDTLGSGVSSNSLDTQVLISNNKITYPRAYSNTNVTYTLHKNMVKEEFILYSLPSIKDYLYLEYTGNIQFNRSLKICANNQCYTPSGTQDDFETEGKIEFKDINNKTIFYLSDPVIRDSSGKTIKGIYSVHGSDAQMNFWLRINTSFIKNATFPLYIDPTIVTTYQDVKKVNYQSDWFDLNVTLFANISGEFNNTIDSIFVYDNPDKKKFGANVSGFSEDTTFKYLLESTTPIYNDSEYIFYLESKRVYNGSTFNSDYHYINFNDICQSSSEFNPDCKFSNIQVVYSNQNSYDSINNITYQAPDKYILEVIFNGHYNPSINKILIDPNIEFSKEVNGINDKKKETFYKKVDYKNNIPSTEKLLFGDIISGYNNMSVISNQYSTLNYLPDTNPYNILNIEIKTTDLLTGKNISLKGNALIPKNYQGHYEFNSSLENLIKFRDGSVFNFTWSYSNESLLKEENLIEENNTAILNYLITKNKYQNYKNITNISSIKSEYFSREAFLDPDVSVCGTISSAGVYTLINSTVVNYPTTCILITASDVTLDGAGLRIDGTDVATQGVQARGTATAFLNNITVQNLKVNDFGYGIFFNYTNYSNVYNVEVNSQADYGVYVIFGVNTFMNNVTATNNTGSNDNGIYLQTANYSIINNSRMYGNYNGLQINSLRNNITNCNFTGNTNYDLYFANSVTDNNYVYNNIFNSSGSVFAVVGADNIYNITATAGTNIIGGSTLGGNYWGNYPYNDTDSSNDDIGSYAWDADNSGDFEIDYLPLIDSSNNKSRENYYNVTRCRNIILSGTYNLSNNTIVNFNTRGCIGIYSNNVVFDGNGFRIDGSDAGSGGVGQAGVGTYFNQNITIRNIIINDFYNGVYLYYNNDSLIENVLSNSSNNVGLYSLLNRRNVVNNVNITNTIGNGLTGLSMSASQYCNFSNMTIDKSNYGIGASGSSGIKTTAFKITQSRITNNSVYGLYINHDDTDDMLIYDNFFNNTMNVYTRNSSINFYNSSQISATNIIGGNLIGGNFYTNASNTGYSDVCVDAEHNGICDNPYNVSLLRNDTPCIGCKGYQIDELPLTIIDSEYPLFYNFAENPTDPATYQIDRVYYFNSTINSTNGTLGIEFNGINYTMSNLSNVFTSNLFKIITNYTNDSIAGNCNTNANAGDNSYTTSASGQSPQCYIYVNFSNSQRLTGGKLQYRYTVYDEGEYGDYVNISCFNYSSSKWWQIKYDKSNGGVATYYNSTIPFSCFNGENMTQFQYALYSDISVTLFYESTINYNGSQILSAGTYNYYYWAYGNGSRRYYNTSDVMTYTVNPVVSDTEYPLFSNYWANNGTVYNNSFNYFNVTTTRTNGTVILSINNTNYTMHNLTADVYNRTINLTANGTYAYYFGAWGNGSSHNYNISPIMYYTVNNTPVVTADTVKPNVTFLKPINNTLYNISQSIEISANVSDNILVSKVFANITLPNGTVESLTLTNTTYANKFNNSYTIPFLIGLYNITFVANDSSNNINSSERTNFTARDNIYPIFYNYWDNNGTVYKSSLNYINVSVNNTNGTVILSINNTNYTMSNTSLYNFNVTINLTVNGTFSYYFGAWGNMTSRNYNITTLRYYTVNNTPITTTINTCSEITSSGVYTLTANITDGSSRCVEISADNVTLDCQSNYINSSTGLETSGIYMDTRANITIKNCKLLNWNDQAIELISTSNSLFENIVINNTKQSTTYNDHGFSLSSSNRNIFRNITGYDVGYSVFDALIYLYQSDNNNMSDFEAYNGGTGLYLYTGADNNIFNDSKIYNSIYGYPVYVRQTSGTFNNLIYNNLLNGTSNIGGAVNHFNTTQVTATNIMGGQYIGGNYWGGLTGSGYSDTCADSNADGICDSAYNLGSRYDYLPLTFYAASDTIKPNVFYTSYPSGKINGEGILFTGYANDNMQVSNLSILVTNNSETPINLYTNTTTGSTIYLSYSFNSTPYENGANLVFTLRARDNFNNLNETNISIQVDHQAPIISADPIVNPYITPFKNYYKNGDEITLRINVTDGSGAGIWEANVSLANINGTNEYINMTFESGMVDPGQYSLWNYSTIIDTTQGIKLIDFYVVDLASPTANEINYSTSITIDNSSPTYTGLSSTTPITNNTLATFYVNLYDNYELGNYIFASNLTGSWVNETPISISGVSDSISVDKIPTNTGNYSYYFIFNDSAGNTNSTSLGNIEVISPSDLVVSLEYPSNNIHFDVNTLTLNYSYAQGVAYNCSLFIDGNYNNSHSYPNNYTILAFETTFADGEYDWQIECIQNVTNVSFLSEARTFTIDTIYPMINITYPLNASYVVSITRLNYTVSDTNIRSCWYSLNNGLTNTSMTCGNNLTGLPFNQGSNYWKVWVNDSVGHVNSSNVTFVTTVDETPPVITILAPTNTTYRDVYNYNFTLNLSITDSSAINRKWWTSTNGLRNNTFTLQNTTLVNLTNGSNFIQVYANDTYGNINNANVTFVLSFTPKIDKINISNTTLSYTRDYLASASDGLIVWYKMDKDEPVTQEDSMGIKNATIVTDLSNNPLRAHYTFNNNLNDSSGANYHLDGKNYSFNSSGKLNQAVQFNHTSSYLNRTVLLDSDNKQSYAVWVYINNLSRNNTIFSYSDTFTANVETDGRIRVLLSSAGVAANNARMVVYSVGTVNINEWTHIVINHVGKEAVNQNRQAHEVEIYINSVLQNETNNTMTNETTVSTSIVIGNTNKTNTPNMSFSGSMDDLRVYNMLLNQDEINFIYNNGVGTEEDINFSFTSIGKVGNARRFYGKVGQMSIGTITNPASLMFNTSSSFTFSLWVKPAYLPGIASNPLLARSFNYGIYYDRNNDTTVRFTWGLRNGSVLQQTTKNSNYKINEWHFVVGTYNATEKKVYLHVDGVEDTAPVSNTNGFNFSTTTALTIASTVLAGNTVPFQGYMDEVRIYNRTISVQEMQTLYTLTNPTFQENANVTINITIKDEDTPITSIYFRWLVDGVEKLAGMALYIFNYIFTGRSQIVTLEVNDTNNYNATQIINITTTYINPAINLTYPLNITYGSNRTFLNYTVSDNNLQACWYSLNEGLTNTTLTCGNNVTGLNSGTGASIWTVYTNDSVGNINSSTVRFFVDIIAPSLTILSPTNTTYRDLYSYNLTINVSISDPNSQARWYSTNKGLTNTTFTGNTTKIFTNGSNTLFVYTNDSVGNVNSSNVTFVLAFTPKINEINISNASDSYTREDINTDLIRYFKFDKNYSIQEDSTGNANATASTGGSNFIHNGVIGGAYEFDGLTNHNVYSTTSINFTNGLSFSLWFKKYTTTTTGIIRFSTPFQQYRLFADNSGIEFDKLSGEIGNLRGSYTLNRWHHVVGVLNDSASELYVDGELVDYDYTIDNNITENISAIYIGSLATAYWFNGSIDEVKIYNRTLSSSEVTTLYSLTNPTFQEYVNSTINITITDEDTPSANLYYKWFVDGVEKVVGFAQNVFNFIFNKRNQVVKVEINDTDGYNVTQSFNITTTFINPTIVFTDPTPSNNTIQQSNTFIVNFTGNETNRQSGWVTFDSTNYTATCYDQEPFFCYVNISSIPYGVHTYRAFVNDTVGNQNYTDLRTITIDTVGLYFDFNYQIPSDITTTNVIAAGLNISYNISDTYSNVNASTVRLYYKTNSSTSNIQYYQNGTPHSGYFGLSGSNTSNIWLFNLSDNYIFPGTYNIGAITMESTAHSAVTLSGQNNYVKIELLNVSGLKNYSFFEFMANSSTTAGSLRVYYCNSSYTGNPVASSSCAQVASLTQRQTFNHVHTINSAHQVVTLNMNISAQTINGIKATSQSYFLLRGNTGNWYVYNAALTSRVNAIQTSTNNGAAWTSQTYTVDSHLHQYDGTDTFRYYVCGNDTLRNSNCSVERYDIFDLGNLPPSAPYVYSPNASNYTGNININYTAAVSPNGYAISYYNISLYNSTSDTYVKSIVSNNLNNLNYFWSANNEIEETYNIHVTAYDINNQQVTGTSDNFRIDYYPVITINYPSNNSYYASSTLNVNYTIVEQNLNSCWYSNSSGLFNTSITCGNNLSLGWIQGLNNVTIYANDSLNQLNSSSISFYIDTVYPVLNITELRNVSASQTVRFNSTAIDTNLNTCFYSVLNASGSVDITNTTYTCNTNLTQFSVSDNGLFNLYIYARDLANNVNYTNKTFTITNATIVTVTPETRESAGYDIRFKSDNETLLVGEPTYEFCEYELSNKFLESSIPFNAVPTDMSCQEIYLFKYLLKFKEINNGKRYAISGLKVYPIILIFIFFILIYLLYLNDLRMIRKHET